MRNTIVDFDNDERNLFTSDLKQKKNKERLNN